MSSKSRADTTIFGSWHWIGSWASAINSKTWWLTARIDGRVVGLALFGLAVVRRHRGLVRTPILYLNQTGDKSRDVVTIEYNEFLADRSYALEVRRACLRYLLQLKRLPDGTRVEAIAWRGALAGELTALLAEVKRPWRVVAEAPTAFVDLAALRHAGRPYLDHLSANTRRQVRRAMTLYRELHGPLRLDVACDVDEGLAYFRAAGALHQARWEPRGKPGAFAYPFYIRFHERLIADGLPQGVVELVRISVGNVPIGYLYNFIYRGTVSPIQRLPLRGDKRLKPGLVSHTLCIDVTLPAAWRSTTSWPATIVTRPASAKLAPG